MASFQKVKAGWRAQVMRRGVRASHVFDTKAKAVKWAGETEAAIIDGKYRAPGAEPATADEMTVGDLFQRFATKVSPTRHKPRWEQNRINAFIRDYPALAATRLSECKPALFADWRDERIKEVQTSTVTRDMGFFSVIFTKARDEWGLIDKSPLTKVRRPKDPKPRDRRISEDEISRLLFALGYGEKDYSTVSSRVGAAFLFAIETAARAGEVVGLTWDRVSFAHRSMHLAETKMGFSRDVALSPRAMKILQSLAPLRDKENKADPVFKVTSSQVDALFRKARDKCKIAGLHFHDTRHEGITRLAKKLPVLDLARMVGIRDLSILMVYYNPTATEIAERLAAD
ncbi:tyrosine-type recombinase/integrase [Burkholderia pseudomallei]|uniref:tyrosine-type recombinase/integrase n=1 Tax=Burkholderia pseudomallei TaxID=28450 RepID=UPI000977A66B|nr:site-specific integrase [Burkholderia pseudomallei]OMR93357.1 hypothetical protein AQ733_10230 [Burkholderia pseudomallei]OMS09962.1 hypothetical protein AQ735_08630 [Burkholderia pseudomallei]